MTNRQTDRRPGKNKMSPDPEGGRHNTMSPDPEGGGRHKYPKVPPLCHSGVSDLAVLQTVFLFSI